MLKRILGLALAVVSCVAVERADAFDLSKGRTHVTLNLASYHLNAAREFNEVNPGLGLGRAFRLGDGAWEADIEVGFYKNSLSKMTYYVMGAVDTEVARKGSTSLRLGGFSGFAHYPGDTNKFKDQGVPTIGNWVLGAGAQATLRIEDRFDIRARAMPAGKVADALFTLQFAAHF